jgi:hypothetical protein
MRSLQQPSNTSKCLNPSTLCTPVAAVLQFFTQVHNPETFLGLHTPCTAPVPNCTFERMRTKETLSETSIYTLLADTSTALLAGISGSDRETIETHSYFLSDFNSNMKSYTHRINKMYNMEQTFMSISFSINTQRTNTKP